MKLFLLLSTLALTACASSPNVQQDCEQQAGSQYWHCKSYPWYKHSCNRFE